MEVPPPLPVAAPVPVAAPLAVPVLSSVIDMYAESATDVPLDIDRDAARLQRDVIAALHAAGQGSAADAMEDATWTLADGEARVQTQLSKTMLPVHMNADAEKIARGVVLQQGARKFTLLPGANVGGGAKKPRAAKSSGSASAQAKAENHPLVQQAQKLFEAEIQTVFDLSGKSNAGR